MQHMLGSTNQKREPRSGLSYFFQKDVEIKIEIKN